MKCLYCGKGIGPIRQLRDLEFCTESHRTQFRDRYRQQLYEALAPEPGPARLADFMERPAESGGPALCTVGILPKPAPAGCEPSLPAVCRVGVERPGWFFSQNPAAMPARLAWQDSTADHASPVPSSVFAMEVRPPARSSAGAAAAHLAAACSAALPRAAVDRIFAPARPWRVSLSLPRAARLGALAQAAPASPGLIAAAPPGSLSAPAGPASSSPVAIVLPPGVANLPHAAPPQAKAAAPQLLAARPSLAGRAAFQSISPAIRAAIAAPNACMPLPQAAPAAALPNAEFASPQLIAAVPSFAVPASPMTVAPSIHTAVSLRNAGGTIAGPAAPAASDSATPLGLSPAVITSQPRPQEAGPLPMRRDLQTALEKAVPVAFEEQGARSIGIFLPKPPAAAFPAGLAALQPARAELRMSSATSRAVEPAPSAANGLRPAMPAIETGAPIGEPAASQAPVPVSLAPMAVTTEPQPSEIPAASPSWQAARASVNPLGPLGEHVFPRVACPAAAIGTLAGAAPAGAMREEAGNRNPRATAADPLSRTEASPLPHDLPALPVAPPGAIASAPAREAAALAPAAPAAAAPSWDATLAASQSQPLVPLADIALPRIDFLPAPAGAIEGAGRALPPSVARSVRSGAVLWTLRVVRLHNPPFRLEPIRAKFNELLRSDRSLPYLGEDQHPVRNNLRQFQRASAAGARKPKWQYIGLAAAALLLAGVLVPKKAPKASGPSLAQSMPWHGVNIRQWMSNRATRNFADDFRAGLSQWKGAQAKWPKSWSYSTDGFIHPGQLALYRPSVPLSDYRFEFMAQVENKSVDWVVRAQDADNYYAVKFTVLQGGPRPTVAMLRYPVIGGSKGARVLTPLRMMIHANTPYRVTVDVKGNNYRAYIEGQEADFWTEDRLKTGGVGFFSEAGERARVYWVKLESHGDILGRICGLLSGKDGGATDKEKEAMDYRHVGNKDLKGGTGVSVAEAGAGSAQEARISRVLSKAASLHLDGKLEDASRELARALDGGERHPALYFALGQLQYEMQEYGPAAASYGQTALLQPLHPTAHFNAGVCQGRIEKWDDAAASFRKAISNDPARSEAHLALGACLVQLGLHNEALEAYDRFLEHHPDHDEAMFGKAVALQKRDRSSEAVELYKRILNRNPQSEEALSNLVSLSLANQDYDQVRKYAQRLHESQPKSQIALEGLAGAAFAAGDHQAAADYSRRLAELAPQVFENWFNLGVACHKAGDLGNASDAYARATRVQPDSPQAHLNLGVALQEQGDLKGARAAYQRALEIDPKLAGVHWNLGLVHEQLGDVDAAEKLYAQVPENSPDSDDAAFRIGHLRLQRGDYPGSIEAFAACLLKRANWPEARLNLGIAHWRSGSKDAARTCFQELTASGTESKEALRGLAALSLEHQEYDKAFEIYRQLLDAGERSPELLYNAGLICQRRGEPEDAAVLYREALKADPQFGEALLNLGHALMSLGNEFEARSCWRKAVIAKPELAQRYFEPAAMAS